MKALMDLFPGLGRSMNEKLGAKATMQRAIAFRKGTSMNRQPFQEV